jgi:hypothetical protein
MTPLHKNWDITLGAVTVITLSRFNEIVATIAGLISLSILGIRLRREWINRNIKK